MWEVSTLAGNPNERGFNDGIGEEALFYQICPLTLLETQGDWQEFVSHPAGLISEPHILRRS